MAKIKGLGVGLDVLLGSGSDVGQQDRLTSVSVEDVVPGRYQPRVKIDDEALTELAESIKVQGVIQPIIVRELGLSQYELIAGERRWRASQLAGLTEIPVVVKSISDETALAMGLIENIQRENLNPIEEAQGLKRLVEEFGLTHEAVAKAIGRSRSSISNSLRLLNLPNPIQELMYEKKLEMGHARAILTLPIIEQIEIANKTVKLGWSVREVEKKVQQKLEQQQAKTKLDTQRNTEAEKIAQALEQILSMPVKIHSKNNKNGQVIIQFDSPDTLAELLKKLGLTLEH